MFVPAVKLAKLPPSETPLIVEFANCALLIVPTKLAVVYPVALVNVALDGVPKAGVTNVGLVANTNDPVPVSSVTAAARFALDGVAKNVAIPVPKPETPVLMGKPVVFVKTPLAGVPRAGVVNIGLVSVLFVSVWVPVSVATTVVSIAIVTAVAPV